MNIQIYSRAKSFDSKKAERWFKERRIPFQLIDLDRKGFSPRELDAVINAVGLDNLIDPGSKLPEASTIKYLSSKEQKIEKLLENPRLIKAPVVRSGRAATVGFCPEIWEKWQ